MIKWIDFLAFFACLYATIKFYRKIRRTRELIFGSFFMSTMAICLYFISGPLNYFLSDILKISVLSQAIIQEWGGIVAISFALVGLAILIRNAKPAFARFPLIFTALPLLLILVHPLVANTIALKLWLMGIYQGGAIIISLMMYAVMTTHDSEFSTILVSVSFFAVSYITYWFLDSYFNSYELIWKLLFSVAVLIATYGYDRLEEAYLSFEKMKSVDNVTSDFIV